MNVNVHTLDLTRNSMIIYIYSEFAEIVCDIGIIVLPYKFRLFCCSNQYMYISRLPYYVLTEQSSLLFLNKQHTKLSYSTSLFSLHINIHIHTKHLFSFMQRF